jgi:putative flippase GtrA
MLSAHIFKHASGPGIGLRQLCDMAVAYDRLAFEPDVLLKTYRKAGLLKWNVLLYSFLRKYLGLRDIFGDSVKTVDPTPLLTIVEEGGNFGHFDASRKEALTGETHQRKIDTAKRYLKRLPFALKYAPREAVRYFIDLIRGNMDTTFIRFAIVGVINTLFGTAIMFVFYNVFHLSYWLSSASNYFFGSILSYFLNKAYTFQYGKTDFRSIVRFTVNILVCYLLAYGIAKPAVAALLTNASVTVQENVSMGVGMVLFVILNYFGQRFFAFKKNR